MANKNSYKYNEKTEQKTEAHKTTKSKREKQQKGKRDDNNWGEVCLFSHVHGRSLLVGGGSALGKLTQYAAVRLIQVDDR